MITENLSTLKIHKLTQEQYDREFESGNLDGNALYLTPDEEYGVKYISQELTDEQKTQARTNIGSAPSGWGYGGAMDYVVDESGTFTDKLDAILAEMPNYSAKQIQFYDKIGLINKKFCGTLWKYTGQYATLEGVNYDGNKVIKCMYAGVWNPWEWTNPPMVPSVEYKTTERWNWKPVYTKVFEYGSLPNNRVINRDPEITGTIIDFEIVAQNSGGTTHKFPIVQTTDGTILACAFITSENQINIKTFSDLSGYSAVCKIKYVK